MAAFTWIEWQPSHGLGGRNPWNTQAVEFFLKITPELFDLPEGLIPFERRELAVNPLGNEREKRYALAESGKRPSLDKKSVGLVHTSLKPTKSILLSEINYTAEL